MLVNLLPSVSLQIPQREEGTADMCTSLLTSDLTGFIPIYAHKNMSQNTSVQYK